MSFHRSRKANKNNLVQFFKSHNICHHIYTDDITSFKTKGPLEYLTRLSDLSIIVGVIHKCYPLQR